MKMAKALKTVDITNVPELLRLAEEVRSTNEPRLLRRDSEDLVVVMPAKPVARPRRTRKPAKAAEEAFRSAFGAWSDLVDGAVLKEDLAVARGSNRPPVSL